MLAVNDTPPPRSTHRGKSSAHASGDSAQPSFEQAIAQVEGIIDRIESGELGLEESIAEYERGIALLARCRTVLAQAEQRVEELSAQMSRDTPPPTKIDQPDPER